MHSFWLPVCMGLFVTGFTIPPSTSLVILATFVALSIPLSVQNDENKLSLIFCLLFASLSFYLIFPRERTSMNSTKLEDDEFYQKSLQQYKQPNEKTPSRKELIFSLDKFQNAFCLDFAACFDAFLSALNVNVNARPARLLPDEIEVVLPLQISSLPEEALSCLARLSLHPALTLLVMNHFNPVWLNIVTAWQSSGDNLAILSAFAKALPVNPTMER